MGQLNPPGAVFLSASVPDPRAEHFVLAGDPAAISGAVSALLYVTLGRRKLVWGGHPAITPMIWSVAAAMDVDYGAWVSLYQSRFFKEDFPEENERFQNVIQTDKVREDRDASLALMRERMMKEAGYYAGVFIGGMHGTLDEYRLLRESNPNAKIIPVASTGGVSELIAVEQGGASAWFNELDYVDLFFNELGIDPNERRYRTIEAQPEDIEARIERPGEPQPI